MSKKSFMKEGYWASDTQKAFVYLYKEGKYTFMNLVGLDHPDIPAAFVSDVEFGDFGPARKEVQDASGCDNYNVELQIGEMKINGVANESGDRVVMWGFSNSVEVNYWLDEDQLQKKKDDRDPVEAPSCPHITPRPGTPGKIYWLSGPPGAGKSTTCQLMARQKDYRYYEADCTMQLINPFTDIYVDNPSIASFSAKSLKGVPRDDAETVLSFGEKMGKFMSGQISGNQFDEMIRPVLKIMGKDILRQKIRLGGDFAVAQAVVSRESRELLKKLMGPELVFIVLNLTEESQQARILARHPGKEQEAFQKLLKSLFAAYEPAGEDEPNAYNVSIDQNMTKDDVMNAVIKTIKNDKPSNQKRMREGFWKFGDSKANIAHVMPSGKILLQNVMNLDYPDLPAMMEWEPEYGQIDEAKPELQEASGKVMHNIKLNGGMATMKAIMNDEGTRIWIWGWSNKMEVWDWLTPENLQAMKDDRDDYLAPSAPHITPRPGTPGRVYWLSGPPGAGKSTTCQLMARNNDYIYYEADCVMQLINPFTDVHADNPTMASGDNRALKGMPKDEAMTILQTSADFDACINGDMSNFDNVAQPLYSAMVKDILRQKERLGGDFAIAHAVATRHSRDNIRKAMGKDVIFIILSLTRKCQEKRILGRHGENVEFGDFMDKFYDLYEPAGRDEPNAFNVTIDDNESKSDVLLKVLNLIKHI